MRTSHIPPGGFWVEHLLQSGQTARTKGLQEVKSKVEVQSGSLPSKDVTYPFNSLQVKWTNSGLSAGPRRAGRNQRLFSGVAVLTPEAQGSRVLPMVWLTRGEAGPR